MPSSNLWDRSLMFGAGLAAGVVLPALWHQFHGGRTHHAKDSAPSLSHVVSRLDDEFRLSTAQLHAIINRFRQQLSEGLAMPGQTLKCLPSYVTRLPTGCETGRFLALDLGGTNLRVCEVLLEGGPGQFRVRQKKFHLSDQVRLSVALSATLTCARVD